MSDTYRRSAFRPKDPKHDINQAIERLEAQESLEEFYEEEADKDSLEDFLKKSPSSKSNFSNF